MRASNQFWLGLGFTLVFGSPVVAAFYVTRPEPPREPRKAPMEEEIPPQPAPPSAPCVAALPSIEPDEREPLPEEEQPQLFNSETSELVERLSDLQCTFGFWTDREEFESWSSENPLTAQACRSSLSLNDTALTALALWCLAENDHCHNGSSADDSCRMALTFLLSRGNGLGWYACGMEASGVSTQALALEALTRLFRATNDRCLVPIIEAAVAATVASRKGAGWSSDHSASEPDLAETGWIVAALQDAASRRCGDFEDDWLQTSIDWLEARAAAERGESVMARAMYVACVDYNSGRREHETFTDSLKAVAVRSNHAELGNHELYWIARALSPNAPGGDWKETLKAKAQRLIAAGRDNLKPWGGGEVFRLALGIRILQMLE